MGVGEDRLSALPDSLIYHIFSFLPIKCVVATGNLSRRWRGLWISSPVFNIQEWRRQSRSRIVESTYVCWGDPYWHQETIKLVSFLDELLDQSHPCNSLTLEKFCLDYDSLYGIPSGNVSGWIRTLMMRKIEELSLCVPTEFWLPSQFFTCETLTVLKIEMVGDLSKKMKRIGTFLYAKRFSFPRLKILHLKQMIFVDESLNAELFSNSPVLEELMLTNCYMARGKVLSIAVPSLKRLFITNSKTYQCKLKICSPNLQSLTYNGMPEDYDHTDGVFSSIVDADIDITFEAINEGTKRSKERRSGLKNLFGGISDVKILRISGSTLVTLYYENMFTQMPTFHDLRQLDVSSKLSFMMCIGLLHLLWTLPNLESVVIAQGLSPIKNYSGLVRYEVPECLLQQLKVVEVREISGKQEDLDMIFYFLKISPALQIMKIAFASSLSENERDGVKEKILLLPKVSTCGVIEFMA